MALLLGEEGFLREQILEKKGHNMNMYGFSIVLPKFVVIMTVPECRKGHLSWM